MSRPSADARVQVPTRDRAEAAKQTWRKTMHLTAAHARSRRGKGRLAPVLALATVATGLMGVTTPPAHATVGQTYACAYWVNVSLFGGPYRTQGCAPQTDSGATANSLAPSVTLPATGGYLTATDADGAKAIIG